MTSLASLISPSKGTYELNAGTQKTQIDTAVSIDPSPLKPNSQATFDILLMKYKEALSLSLKELDSAKKNSSGSRRRQSRQVSQLLDRINVTPQHR